MQKAFPMHLNTSPTSFEGTGTGKHKQKHKTFKKIKLAPKKKLGKQEPQTQQPQQPSTLTSDALRPHQYA